MIHIYGGGFGYGEAYVTARLYAESVVMLGLSLLAARPLAAVALLVAAAALHPLMALPGLAIAFVYLALERPIWWAVMAAGVAVAAALGAAGIAPFSNLLRTIDPEWFAIIDIRSPHTLLHNWPADAFTDIGVTVALGLAALVLAGPAHRRFLTATLVVGVGGLVLTFIGGDVLHNVFVVEIQPWRSMWLLQIVARICVPLVFAAILARTSFDSFRWAVLLSLAMALSACVTRLVRHPGTADFTPLSLLMVAVALGMMAVHLLTEQQKHGAVLLASTLAGLVLVPVALARWDSRSPWIRYVESPEPTPKELAVLVPDDASVYWESGLEMLWLRMRHASYFSCDQGTGVVFYRQTALAYKHRSASVWPLRTGDFTALDSCIALDPKPAPMRDRAGLQQLCRKEPGLDLVILARPLEGIDGKTWQAPVRFQDLQSSAGAFFARVADRFYIYSCASVR
jgi:hypothetical protein